MNNDAFREFGRIQARAVKQSQEAAETSQDVASDNADFQEIFKEYCAKVAGGTAVKTACAEAVTALNAKEAEKQAKKADQAAEKAAKDEAKAAEKAEKDAAKQAEKESKS